jgi:hypothetical protein
MLAPAADPQRDPETHAGQLANATDEYRFPQELREFLVPYSNFGAQIWAERRRGFAHLLAICEVARAHSQSPQDSALCADILRIGQRFKLLPK